MDNGVEIVKEIDSGEKNKGGDEKLQLKLVNGDRNGSGGHERKDSEVDEIFEEAVDGHGEDVNTLSSPHAQLQKESAPLSFSNGGVENGEKSYEMVVNASTPEGHEIENFEEAMESAMESPMGDQPYNEEMPNFAENVTQVYQFNNDDNENSAGLATPVETNGVIEKEEAHAREIPVLLIDGETNTLMAEEQPEKFDVFPVENYVEGERDVIDPLPGSESNEQILPQGDLMKNQEAFVEADTLVDIRQVETNGVTDDVNAKEVVGLSLGIETNGIISSLEDGQNLREPLVEGGTLSNESSNLLQGETSIMEAHTKTDEKNKVVPSAPVPTDWQASRDGPSDGIREDGPHHSDIIDKTDQTDQLESVHEPQQIKEEGINEFSFNASPAPIMSEREYVSIEEYGESSSTGEEDNEPNVKPSPVTNSSTKISTDFPTRSRPAGLGSSAPLLEPAPHVPQHSRVHGSVQQRQPQPVEEPVNAEAEEYDETREKLQMIRVKFLRLASRLGQTPHNVVVAQVLYRLGLAEQLRGSQTASRAGAFSFDRASAMAELQEAAGQEPLDFSCTIMVIGKTGVGKSATINSIFDEVKFNTSAFQLGTKKVQDIVGTIQGIKVRVIDTPGLLSSCTDQRYNQKILHSVKRFIKKTPPDIVLYFDRLDMQSRDFGDIPLLRTITDTFGLSIWFNAIVVLTHAASAPPDGPTGTPLSYEMFLTQRSHVVQLAIRQAAGDLRLMNPVTLVENHSACRTNRAGQRVLPNGQVWKPQLLLLSFASKILAEANTLLKMQENPPGKPFGARSRVPPLPFLLSSLLQSRPQLKLPEEQVGDEDDMDEDLDEASDSDDESEYNELPPFKRLTKSQIEKLSKAQKKAYFDELELREKLFMKKQLKEEKKRRIFLKKMAAAAKELPSDYNENTEEESGGAASVPVPMPDLALPTSFDSDNPTHRYRYLDTSNQWLMRPVLENNGWDHDVGYEGLNVERLFVVKEKIPVSFSGQVTKDKKECNLQMELASSVKHGEGKATSLGFDIQTVGKDMAYTLRSDTRFSNFRHNKTAAGLSVTALGDAITAGIKLEDRLMVHKRFRVVMTGGAMMGRGDVAYGGSLEAILRDKDYPLGRTLSTLGLSIMDWHGDLAIGCNVQSQFPVGRTTNMITRANLNNKGSGQFSIRLNSSEQLQIAVIALVPVLRSIIRNIVYHSSSQSM